MLIKHSVEVMACKKHPNFRNINNVRKHDIRIMKHVLNLSEPQFSL